MEFVEKTISNLIESQFPSFYQEEGPVFIEFAKAYYEWMESANNTLYHARRILEYRDVDSTVDDFLIHFKSKYLNNLQYETAVDSAEIVKHSLDLYRSKGTERSIDLFFKSVFGVPATVYYPSSDIFKTSAAEWIVPKYLEMAPAQNFSNFIGVQIEGTVSGATAFVDRFVRKRTKASAYYTNLYYITNIVGDFKTGEKIKNSKTGEIGPTIIGSMNTLTVIDGGADYAIGDTVTIESSFSGQNGKARVSDVEAISGKTDFTLIDGGWGYTSNAEVLISTHILTLDGVVATGPFNRFETIAQYTANIAYGSLTSGSFSAGDQVNRIDANNQIFGTAIVLSVSATDANTGFIFVSATDTLFDATTALLTEDLSFLAFENGQDIELDGSTITSDNLLHVYADLTTEDDFNFTFEDTSGISLDGNVMTANIVTYTDTSAFGNVMATSANLNINISNVSIRFANNESVYVLDVNNNEIANGTIRAVSYTGSNGSMAVINSLGAFTQGSTIYSRTTNASAIASNILYRVGVIDEVNNFTSKDGNMVFLLDSGATATISKISSGFGASFDVSNTLLYTQDATFDTTVIQDFLNIPLSANNFGLRPDLVSNLNSVIADSLITETDTFGRLSGIIVRSFGEDYDSIPLVMVYERKAASQNKKDYTISISNTVGTFQIGEAVLQAGEYMGLVKTANSSVLYVQRISFDDPTSLDIIGTEDGSPLESEALEPLNSEQGVANLIGERSGATAYPISFDEDALSTPIGMNAIINANTVVSNGSVTTLTVTDSGFNYFTGETVTFFTDEDSIRGTAKVIETKQGTGTGYHRSNDSVLSGNKYIQDGNYYQRFSYEIQAPLTLDKYSDMLKNVLHIAGTKAFAKFISQTTLELDYDVAISEITIG